MTNILIIESLDSMRDALSKLSEDLGFEKIFAVKTGAEALDIVQNEDIQIIVADSTLSDMTGLDVIHFVEKYNLKKPLPVVLLTQDSGAQYNNALEEAGASVVLAKPFNGLQFKEKVSLVFDKVYGEKLSVNTSSELFPDLITNLSPENVILVVDDEPANIELATGLLRNDYKVRAATNGKKALDVVNRCDDIDLILLDIMMPEMDGYEVCRQLKANTQTADIPVIFLTAKSETEHVTLGFDLGAVDYITKPLQPEILKARVKTHVSLRNSHRRLKDQISTLKEVAKLREDIEKLTHHDLKGPLGVILFELYKIKDKSVADAIEESVTNVINMINNSLDVFKIEKGQYEFNPVEVDFNHLIDLAVRSVGRLATQKGIKIEVENGGLQHAILAEKLLCMAIFNNLVKNAIEASPDDETVAISYRTEGEQVVFEITNTGAIPQDLRANLFDKYATSNHIRGSGLGTYSAKLMTDKQNGSIDFTIIDEEKTRFTVKMPAYTG